MSKSFTYNVVLTKSKDIAERLFFDKPEGRVVNRKRLDTIFTGFSKEELDDGLIVAPFVNSGFISMVNEFPGGGAPRFVTMKFVESVKLLEKFLIPSNSQDELIASRFRKRIRNLTSLDNETLDIIRQIRPRFYLSYGVGDDVSEWAGPYVIDLMDANLTITSDGVRELELGFTPTVDTVKVFTNRQFIDEDLSQEQSVFDSQSYPMEATLDLLEVKTIPGNPNAGLLNAPAPFKDVDLASPTLEPQNTEGHKWNNVIRRLIRAYLSKKYTTIPEANILVLFNNNLDIESDSDSAPFNRRGLGTQTFEQLYRDLLGEYGIMIGRPKVEYSLREHTVNVPPKDYTGPVARGIFDANISYAPDYSMEVPPTKAAQSDVDKGEIAKRIKAAPIRRRINEITETLKRAAKGELELSENDLINLEQESVELSKKISQINNETKIKKAPTLETRTVFERVPARRIDPNLRTFGFFVKHDPNDIDSNKLESLRPLYKLFSELKKKLKDAFDPIIFEENDVKITSLLAKYGLIEDGAAPVIVVGDRTLIRDLMYSNSPLPSLDYATSYGVSEGQFLKPFTSQDVGELKGSWTKYKQDVAKTLYARKKRTSSFGEKIDLGPYTNFSKNITDDSVVFMHNLKNSNVIDVSFDASPYKGELLNVANESAFKLLDQGLKSNQVILDNSLKMDVFDYLKGDLETSGVDPTDLTRVIRVIKNNNVSIQKIQLAGLDRIPAVDFLSLLTFKLSGNELSDLSIKNPPGQTAKVAADTFRKASSYILRVNLKTLPFFNTVDFMNRRCVLIGAPNKILGSKVTPDNTPAVYSNGYNIFGYKHVIEPDNAYSEFTLFQSGLGEFPSDVMKLTTKELLGIEEGQESYFVEALRQ